MDQKLQNPTNQIVGRVYLNLYSYKENLNILFTLKKAVRVEKVQAATSGGLGSIMQLEGNRISGSWPDLPG